MKFLVFPLAFLNLGIGMALGQPNRNTTAPVGDNHYIRTDDSLLLSLGPSGERYLHYRIRPGQTLYGFSRYLKISLQRIYALNPGLTEQNLEAGRLLRVPLPANSLKTNRTPGFRQLDFPAVYYPVRKGDNLYRVAGVLLDMSADTLKQRNALVSDQLQEGRLLHVGWFVADQVAADTSGALPMELSTDQAGLAERFRIQSLQKKEVQQTGKATWKRNQAANSGFSALHSFAPVNAVISVINPMNNRELFVKVIGQIPDTVYDKATIVVLSPAAARFLGARDASFFAKVKYHQ